MEIVEFRKSGYYAREDGVIFSKKSGGLKEMKPSHDKDGYLYLKLCIDKKPKHFRVHRVIAECFVDGVDLKKQVNHIDGNKKNNYFENLEWVTDKENKKHSIKAGLSPRGERARHSKLTEKQVAYIFKNHKSKGTKYLAEKFNIDRTSVQNIMKRKTWKHLKL